MDDFSTGEFIQGFLEESGEHLRNIRQNLLRMEELLISGDEETEAEQVQLINELFRSFHTIKGLAGMIGLSEAANLSHAMETVLQAVRGGQAQIQPATCDRLLEGTRVLQTVIEGLNQPKQDRPDTGLVLAQIGRILHEEPAALGEALAGTSAAAESNAASASAAAGQTADQELLTLLPDLNAYPEVFKTLGMVELQKIRQAVRGGQVLSLAFFTPSAEKSVRGENVDFVRSRLAQVGTLIKAVPLMQNGAIRFAFLVGSAQPVDAADMALDEVALLAAQVASLPQAHGGGTPGRAPGGTASGPLHLQNRSSTVRVELDRLDEMVRYASDLVILRARLGENLSRLEGAPVQVRRELNQTYQQLGRTLRDLRRAILRARMVPLSEVFSLMPLVVRDVARSTGKEVSLKIEGESAEVDKMLVDGLLDPLMHLLRNAVIHGIDLPEERARVGKPPRGTLLLRGQPEGDHILITVADDGRGVDLARVRQKAEALGWLEPGHEITQADVLDLLTRSGFSTRDQADLAAGRGVGLEIVAKMVHSVGGSLEIDTTPGQGTTFRIRLPLTLMIMDALIVKVGAERFAVPRDMVDEVIEVDPQDVVRLESGDLIQHRGSSVVLHSLARLMGLPSDAPASDPSHCLYGLVRRSIGRQDTAHQNAAHQNAAHQNAAHQNAAHQNVAHQNAADQNAANQEGAHYDALLVDRVENIREVVVHTINEPLIAHPGIGGATELGDGQVILILDLPALLRLGR